MNGGPAGDGLAVHGFQEVQSDRLTPTTTAVAAAAEA